VHIRLGDGGCVGHVCGIVLHLKYVPGTIRRLRRI